MNKSESITKLAAALAKAQAAVQTASKSAENPAFKRDGKPMRYADLTAVWDACRAALASNGLSVVQMPADAGEGRVGLTTVLLHESGEFISGTVSTRLQKDDAQGLGSALTYLRRYSLASFVGIVADEDDDGNAASAPRQQVPRPAPQVPASNGEAFDPATARARIAALTGVTQADKDKAAKLSDRESLGALYKEVASRGK